MRAGLSAVGNLAVSYRDIKDKNKKYHKKNAKLPNGIFSCQTRGFGNPVPIKPNLTPDLVFFLQSVIFCKSNFPFFEKKNLKFSQGVKTCQIYLSDPQGNNIQKFIFV